MKFAEIRYTVIQHRNLAIRLALDEFGAKTPVFDDTLEGHRFEPCIAHEKPITPDASIVFQPRRASKTFFDQSPMFCESIVGNLNDGMSAKPTDLLDLAWHETLRRALRKRTRAGREIGILLSLGQRLTHHAILVEMRDVRIVVNVLPTEVLIASPASNSQMGRLAWELGNLHAPVQIAEETLVTLADGPVEELLDRLGIRYVQATRRFEPMAMAAPVALAYGFRIIESASDPAY